ncbi:MAG: hypothetical protein GXO89_15290 [Chlorobi bacterium]|nr:hypothetical protein [Chlorobiota bacterium]
MKKVVTKEIEEGVNIPEPNIVTDLDKEIRQLTKAIPKKGNSVKSEESAIKKK